ncbi:MAG: hypothetical protein AAFZ38_11305 [Myxococcota bacterium]
MDLVCKCGSPRECQRIEQRGPPPAATSPNPLRGQFSGDLTLFGYAASNPGRYTDVEGESAVADAIPVAIGLAAADGPVLPFGDAAGAVVLAGALAVDIALLN